MKRINSVALVLVAAVLFFASAKDMRAEQPKSSRAKDTIFANSLTDGGRVRMKHSPVLGFNVSVSVRIDGAQAGVFGKGHVYEKFLTPGRHDLYVSRSGQAIGSWRGSLEVRPGETYSYVVKCNSREVFLQKVSRID